jgi:iron-sulfur cluster repair protein YtfE (RIC family)
MLASEILTQDHREALDLIERLENADDGEAEGAAEAFNLLKASLAVHMRAEEEIYYPALAKYEEFSDILEDSVPEHEMVRQQLVQMSSLAPSSEEFQSVLAEMKTAIEAHAENEEDDIFPEAEEVLGEARIEALGREIESLKNESGTSRTARM